MRMTGYDGRLGWAITTILCAAFQLRAGIADFAGSDNFDDNATDSLLWTPFTLEGSCDLTEANSRLHFTSTYVFPFPPINNVAIRTWVKGNAPFGEDWEVQVSGHLPAGVPSDSGDPSEIGLTACPNDIANFYGYENVAGVSLEPGTVLESKLIHQSSSSRSHAFGSDAVFRLRWDAVARTLYTAVSPDGGTTWQTQWPEGLLADSEWNMSASDHFVVSVFGQAQGVTVNLADNMYLDDFRTWRGPWSGAADVGSGWRLSDWFGSFADVGSGWIYHLRHGWMYAAGASASSLWLYTFDLGWLWTSRNVYPWLYLNDRSAWAWYYLNSQSPRWFYVSQGGWESHY